MNAIYTLAGGIVRSINESARTNNLSNLKTVSNNSSQPSQDPLNDTVVLLWRVAAAITVAAFLKLIVSAPRNDMHLSLFLAGGLVALAGIWDTIF